VLGVGQQLQRPALGSQVTSRHCKPGITTRAGAAPRARFHEPASWDSPSCPWNSLTTRAQPRP
jgi:hypothetical protein